MAFRIINTDTIPASGTAANLSTTDDIIILAGVTLGSTAAAAVDGTGDNHLVEVFGNVVATANLDAFLLAAITLGNNGSINFGQVVNLYEGAMLYSATTGISLFSHDNAIDNAGRIQAGSVAISLTNLSTTTTTTIDNSGLILATADTGIGIRRSNASTERVVLTNTGLIEAGSFAYTSNITPVAVDEITNSGRIIGDIKLFGGNDLYDGRLGRLTGVVEGGDGTDRLFGGVDNDTFLGDAGTDTLDGGVGNDSLSGGADNDTLRGGAGNDRLDGGAGVDRMEGGAGNDVYLVDSASDVEVEGANQGTDTVNASISFALANNFENLTLTGATNINGTGNAVANVVTGNTGNNLLSGLGGNDSLTGLAGADRLTGGVGADRFVYKAIADSTVSAAGRDTITDFSHAQGDRINLSTIDANSDIGGNQAFAFIGTDAFSATAGELRQFRSGANTIVQADTDGNGAADFAITLTGALTLVAGDFVL